MSLWYSFFIYFIGVLLKIIIIKILRYTLVNCKVSYLKWTKRKQFKALNKNKIKSLVRSIKTEMFIEDKLNKLTPYFPYIDKKSYSDEELRYAIRKDYDLIYYYLKSFSPLNLINILLIYLIIFFYLEIKINDYLFNEINWGSIDEVLKYIPLLPSFIIFILVIIAIYFSSRGGLVRKAKNKVKVEEIELKIKFHKENEVLLSYLLVEGYNNIEHILLKKDYLILKKREENYILFEELRRDAKDLKQIEELNSLINEFLNNKRGLNPFFIGIHHISFFKIDNLYREIPSLTKSTKSRVDKLNEIFFTKDHIKILENQNNFIENFEDNFNKSILRSVKMIVYIEKYLDIIYKELNNPHSIYTFLAFITNKDK